MPNNLSIKDGLGQGQTLKTFSGSNGHVPYHVIEEISGSSIGAVTSSLSSIDTKSTSISSSLASISASIASSKYATSTSTAVYPYNQGQVTISSGSAVSFIVSNLTNANLYILLGSGTPSNNNYSYFVPPSGSYESMVQNARLAHALTASAATAGNYSVTVTI